MRFGMIYLTGELAEAVTIERAQELNSEGYAVTVSSGKVLIEKEKERIKRKRNNISKSV